MNEHDKIEMVKTGDRYPRKHTGNNGRRWNVWHIVLQCPTCGAKKRPLANTSKGKAYYCDGRVTPNQEMDEERNH